MSKQSYFKLFNLALVHSLVLFDLSGTTTLGQSGPGSDGNKGILHIPQSSSITGTSPSDCLVSYLRHLFGGSYLVLALDNP